MFHVDGSVPTFERYYNGHFRSSFYVLYRNKACSYDFQNTKTLSMSISNDRASFPAVSHSLADEMSEFPEDDFSDSSLETTTRQHNSLHHKPLHQSLSPLKSSSTQTATRLVTHSPSALQPPPQQSLNFRNLLSLPHAIPNINFSRRDALQSNHSVASAAAPSITGATFARDAPKAGYLYKDSKRRFFVLKPTTCLYYFANPTDREPRGCIDLDSGATISESSFPKAPGRFAFEISLVHGTKIELEADDDFIGREWIQYMTLERLSHSKSVVESLSAKVAALEKEKLDLHDQLERYHGIEHDREGAIQDAQAWKCKWEQMNQGLELLRSTIVEDTTDLHWLHEEDTTGQENDENHPLLSLHHSYRRFKRKIYGAYSEYVSTKDKLQKALDKITELEGTLKKSDENRNLLWEENTSLRENYNLVKKERKVLAKEVRSLRASNIADQEERDRLKKECEELTGALSSLKMNGQLKSSFIQRRKQLATPEKRLFFELEDSVTTNLLLNEKFLASQGEDDLFLHDIHGKVPSFHHKEPIVSSQSDWNEPFIKSTSQKTDDEEDKDLSVSSRSVSPLRPKALASIESLSRVNLSLLDSEPDSLNQDTDHNFSSPTTHFNVEAKVQQNKPIATTTDDDVATSTASTVPCDSSVQSSIISTRSLVTSNGEATTTLVCPFVDVTDTRSHDTWIQEWKPTDLGQIYHLTFYGAKIGIQFQKVPAETFNNGKLADAMTSDLFDDHHDYIVDRRKTQMDLEKIKIISARNSSDDFDIHKGDGSSCPVIFPKDIVLVCGFHGFDDLSNNKRPHLGARLIAFDGISVEVGPWTFDSIRKSIQARGRPITLSFRNEYLSVKQRSILTKAVTDVDSSIPTRGPSFHQQALSERWKSFSDAGSTTSTSRFSSKFGPVMTNLVSTFKTKETVTTPGYLTRAPHFVESMKQHQDFRSSLL